MAGHRSPGYIPTGRVRLIAERRDVARALGVETHVRKWWSRSAGGTDFGDATGTVGRAS
jgi:hypothetical protein